MVNLIDMAFENPLFIDIETVGCAEDFDRLSPRLQKANLDQEAVWTLCDCCICGSALLGGSWQLFCCGKTEKNVP